MWQKRNLGLQNKPADLDTVVSAVKAEHRRAAKSVKLRALEVVDHNNGLYELKLSGFPSLDWTWEGAVAFRPHDLYDELGTDEKGLIWKADVVGFEPDESSLFVTISPENSTDPCKGSFLVKPFDFIWVLLDILTAKDLYPAREDLSVALANARDLDQGQTLPGDGTILPETVWGSSWGVLWGPPGTGKTYSIGQIVGATIGVERILVVSTTNKATDSAAVQIGRSIRDRGHSIKLSRRLGSGANFEVFEGEGLSDMIAGSEADIRRKIASVNRKIRLAKEPVERARLQVLLLDLKKQLVEAGKEFSADEKQVVLCTAYGAMSRLVSQDVRLEVAAGRAPFSTVILDEAGLLSTTVTACLSLLSSKRVLLVGDPKQLAPISKICRILPPDESRWLGSSGLTPLNSEAVAWHHVHQLTTQYRMAPDIRRVVSAYQYDNRLEDASQVVNRPDPRGKGLANLPRCIWYVLDDDDGGNTASIRAVRGPGNRSWVRPRTTDLLLKLFKGVRPMAESRGLFITPFTAQARRVRRFFSESGYSNWTASTVHAQQGAEADWVIFDTVHASSTGWPFDEWKRLINVAVSRAREQFFLFASRAEMQEPYFGPLVDLLDPIHVSRGKWRRSKRYVVHQASFDARQDPNSLGAQVEKRKALRPVLSGDQERLCGYTMDGKPRLVRGVAGSGKTYVLGNWLAQTVGANDFEGKAWVLYANQALKSLLEKTVREAWEDRNRGVPFPHDRVEFLHIYELLEGLCRAKNIRVPNNDRFNYDATARLYLERVPRESVVPRCKALFIDEAQDFGHHTLELCFALVEGDAKNPASKPSMVFYDNAQDIYSRGTPIWSNLGLNIQGRSTVMKESFRSTRPINEFAMNVLFRLDDPMANSDHRELINRGLVEEQQRDGDIWWKVHFNRVDGPQPVFRTFVDRGQEMNAMAEGVRGWIMDEGMRPKDIKILCNSPTIRNKVLPILKTTLSPNGVRVVHEVRQTFSEQDDTLIVSTAHSFKGYEAEAVVIPGADKFALKNSGVLTSALYVAMTRARSLLYVSSIQRLGNGPERNIVDALSVCDKLARTRQPADDLCLKGKEAADEIAERFVPEHRHWVENLAKLQAFKFEPILREDGSIVAEPAFWFETEGKIYAGFVEPIDAATGFDLEDVGVIVLAPGEIPDMGVG